MTSLQAHWSLQSSLDKIKTSLRKDVARSFPQTVILYLLQTFVPKYIKQLWNNKAIISSDHHAPQSQPQTVHNKRKHSYILNHKMELGWLENSKPLSVYAGAKLFKRIPQTNYILQRNKRHWLSILIFDKSTNLMGRRLQLQIITHIHRGILQFVQKENFEARTIQ